MSIISKTMPVRLHLPTWAPLRAWLAMRRRKQATIDLIHASPHLLRDIGATESNLNHGD